MLLLCAISDTTATSEESELAQKLVILCAMFLLFQPILCKVSAVRCTQKGTGTQQTVWSRRNTNNPGCPSGSRCTGRFRVSAELSHGTALTDVSFRA
jgi:hypothetical protein